MKPESRRSSRILRVVASTDAPGLDAPISSMFARAPYFVIVDLENGRVKGVWSYPNTLAGAGGGAGRAAAQWIISIGASMVVAPTLGTNASMILGSAGIRVLVAEPGKKLRDVLRSHGLIRE